MGKKVDYNEERDIMYVNLGDSVESVPKGGFVIQLDSQGQVVGLEVHNASEVLSEFTDVDIDEMSEILENYVDADCIIKNVKGVAYVAIEIKSVVDGEEVTETVNMPVPEPAPA